MLQVTITDDDLDLTVGPPSSRGRFLSVLCSKRLYLGSAAKRERYVIGVYKGDVVTSGRILNIVQRTGNRSTIDAQLLPFNDKIALKYEGEPAPLDPRRNPVKYLRSDLDIRRCLCECGTEVVSSDFAPGHDARAVFDRVRAVGDVPAFLRWFDSVWSRA